MDRFGPNLTALTVLPYCRALATLEPKTAGHFNVAPVVVSP